MEVFQEDFRLLGETSKVLMGKTQHFPFEKAQGKSSIEQKTNANHFLAVFIQWLEDWRKDELKNIQVEKADKLLEQDYKNNSI